MQKKHLYLPCSRGRIKTDKRKGNGNGRPDIQHHRSGEAAAQRDLDARKQGYPDYAGKRFILAYIEGDWCEVDEFSEPQLAEAEGFGVSDETGEQMLGTDGEWYYVA